MPPTLILASQSPRRQEFMRNLGLDFAVRRADLDETPHPGENPTALAARLAHAKARVVAAQLRTGSRTDDSGQALILAADTVVALGDQLLGKPIDPADARQMLVTLRGQTHQVISGISILATATGRQITRTNCTLVTMRNYSDAELEAYIATGDPMDKAGAYAIQHAEFAPVARLEGCFSGVMGLPLGDLRDLLTEFGVSVAAPLAPICLGHGAAACCHPVHD